ncbi:hypothetical protein VTN00DRAFT_499 [Thermoascus crustaceus]|uniref:uncharacterized protein n=1 Tax=Thermoascus crustaceus TaxID=5088 RepID=UPI0037433095
MSTLDPDDELTGITAADVTFIQQLKESMRLCIFQVAVRGKTCVMKVGIIPDFYGVIEQIDPTIPAWQPHLKSFLEYELRPSAVLIEHIPNILEIHLSTFLEARMAKLRTIDNRREVLLIDFDRAQTLSEDLDLLTPKQKMWLEDEIKFIIGLLRAW